MRLLLFAAIIILILPSSAASEYVYAFNKTGALLWRYKLDSQALRVAVSADGKYIAAGDEVGISLFNGS